LEKLDAASLGWTKSKDREPPRSPNYADHRLSEKDNDIRAARCDTYYENCVKAFVIVKESLGPEALDLASHIVDDDRMHPRRKVRRIFTLMRDTYQLIYVGTTSKVCEKKSLV